MMVSETPVDVIKMRLYRLVQSSNLGDYVKSASIPSLIWVQPQWIMKRCRILVFFTSCSTSYQGVDW